MKIRKRVILLGLSLGIILSQFIMYENNKAYASNWITISQDGKSFIDTSSISSHYCLGNNCYSVWLKHLNKGDDEDKEINAYLGKVWWYKKVQYVINCQKKEIATKSIAFYDLHDEPITEGIKTLPDYNLSWESVIPETIGEGILNTACIYQQNNTNYTNPYLYQR